MKEFIEIVCSQCGAVNRMGKGRLRDRPKCGKCKEDLFSAHPVDLTAETFQRTIARTGIPVVVDFWAPWCGPCKMMAPVFEQAAAQLEPKVRLAKVNTDMEKELAGQLGIQSIPTLIIFKNGKEIARRPGAMDWNNLFHWIQSNI